MALSDEQKDFILQNWADMRLDELTSKVFPDGGLNPHSDDKRAVVDYIQEAISSKLHEIEAELLNETDPKLVEHLKEKRDRFRKASLVGGKIQAHKGRHAKPTPLNDPVLFLLWIGAMGGCFWLIMVIAEKGWVVGFPIAFALGTTGILFGWWR